MRILYVITKSEIGGAQTQVYQLSKYFAGKGNHVAVMAYPGGWLESEIKKIGCTFYSNEYFSNSLNPYRLFLALREINRAIKNFGPDLINCHSSAAGILVRLLVRNKIPTIFNAVGWSFNIGVPIIQKHLGILSEKIAANFCSIIIANSKFVKNLGLKYSVGTDQKYKIVYNGVDNRIMLHKEKKDINSTIKIIFVARLAEPKNPIMFLEGYRAIPEEIRSKSEVLIIGAGPKQNEIVNYININKLQNSVFLLGEMTQENVFKVLLSGDIFALCTKWESFPYTVIEGMLAGLACVASNVGGIGEALENNHGLLVGNTIEEWRDALKSLLQSRIKILELGLRGRNKAIREFTIDKMFIETEIIYKELLKKYERSEK